MTEYQMVLCESISLNLLNVKNGRHISIVFHGEIIASITSKNGISRGGTSSFTQQVRSVQYPLSPIKACSIFEMILFRCDVNILVKTSITIKKIANHFPEILRFIGRIIVVRHLFAMRGILVVVELTPIPFAAVNN